MSTMPTVTLPSGEKVSRLGQGTWTMGEKNENFEDEVKALQYGVDLGMTLIDTAEMYGDGGAEKVVGKAVQGRRDDVFIVSKAYPQNASREKLVKTCEQSLSRLQCETIDLYLLHWRGSVPLSETVETFEKLVSDGKIRYWGVSNFDTDDMEELLALPQGKNVQTNQVLYNLNKREMEWSLEILQQKHRIPTMAYCPLGQGELSSNQALKEIANRHQATALQIALAWLLAKDDVISIPKSVNPRHLKENFEALSIKLSDEDLTALNKSFPAPKKQVALATV